MSRALIVASNNFDRERYKRILVDLEVEVSDKPRVGTEALQIFRVMKPELVILDMIFPGMSGLDLLRSMKNDFDGGSILFLTPINTRSVMERAFRLRAEDVLIKPFSDEEFASTVLHLLKNNEHRNHAMPILS
jgi:CheY-like chemotaxis protein